MARLHSCTASFAEMLTDGWECTSTPASSANSPAERSDSAKWLPAQVPGTFAAALQDAGEWNGEAPLELDHRDIWYRTRFAGGSDETLHFDGLATIADVWLNGELVRRSENMFLPCAVGVRTQASNELYICFRSLTSWLSSRRGRARWRTRLATPATLRFARTTLLGRMPGWCPTIHPVGPWRPVRRVRRIGPYTLCSLDARPSLADGDGRLAVRFRLEGEPPTNQGAVIEIDGVSGQLDRISADEFAGEIAVPKVRLWWPHTHGNPYLHEARLRLGDVVCDLGRLGFRTIDADSGTDGAGFGLRVNGEPIFCRGACWTTPNIVTLPCSRESYRPWLEALRDAGANTVRVSGTMVYEAEAFYDLCDELGLLVWQDAMLANFDYPDTEAFRSLLIAEVQSFLDRTQLNASLAVFCGGSEVMQQAAMFGVPKERIDDTLYRSVLPGVVRKLRPDLAYVPNSPSGGELAFLPNSGVSHYYGVGAYCRPLDDARRAKVRFASECLALANVPSARTVEELGISSTTDPRWKRSVPRDNGVSWDFEDIRDHYLATLFKVEPLRLRYVDFVRYVHLSRAVSCVLIEETFNEWRRVGSTCQGALVWQWQDVVPGAGWGLLDSRGRRKPAWYALRRACRTRQIILTDEGLNGLAVHILNERAEPLRAKLRLACLSNGQVAAREAEREIEVAARSAICLWGAELFPAFFDITQAYRFGPPAHNVTIASLHDPFSGELIADTCHFPDIAALQPHDIGLSADVVRDGDGWALRLMATSFAQFLSVDDEAFTAAENWFHLPPGQERHIALLPDGREMAPPRGEVRALNMDRVVHYAGRE
jgi:beta-mannosidase